MLWSCCTYTVILTLSLPNVEKTNSVTIKVSVNIGLGMVCKQLHTHTKKKKVALLVREGFLFD